MVALTRKNFFGVSQWLIFIETLKCTPNVRHYYNIREK